MNLFTALVALSLGVTGVGLGSTVAVWGISNFTRVHRTAPGGSRFDRVAARILIATLISLSVASAGVLIGGLFKLFPGDVWGWLGFAAIAITSMVILLLGVLLIADKHRA